MYTLTRRSFVALSTIAALSATPAVAASRPLMQAPLASCGAAFSSPEIHEVDSEVSFDEAYIDTTIPYLTSGAILTEAALDVITDERALPIAERILEEQVPDIEHLGELRHFIFGDAEPAEATKEKMLIAMGGMESCTDQNHMLYMDSEWVLSTFQRAKNPYVAWVSMMVLLLEMELHQHSVGVELAEDADLKAFCERQLKVKSEEVEILRELRQEHYEKK